MPRSSRKTSNSGYYHIILRGNNKQEIFLYEQDYQYFLKILGKHIPKSGSCLIAYCLMGNHIHILVQSTSLPSRLIQAVASTYGSYFNKKYERIGHLFQDRYKSETVESERYFLQVIRYILQNPTKAGICSPADYRWNSWNEMYYPVLCDMSLPLKMLGSRENMIRFMESSGTEQCMDFNTNRKKVLSDREALQWIRKYLNIDNPAEIASYSRKDRNRILALMKKTDMTIRQISRLTGLSKSMVERA